MKYFFLSESWTTARVWEFGGLWNELAWHRKPYLRQRSLCIKEQGETLCLYEAEENILMVEVMPKAIGPHTSQPGIGQVVLKRLLSAEQAIERLCQEDDIFQQSARRNHDDSHNASDTHTTATEQLAGRDAVSAASVNFDHQGNGSASNIPQQSHTPTDTDETSPALQTSTMRTSRVNQEPVAINDYGQQG